MWFCAEERLWSIVRLLLTSSTIQLSFKVTGEVSLKLVIVLLHSFRITELPHYFVAVQAKNLLRTPTNLAATWASCWGLGGPFAKWRKGLGLAWRSWVGPLKRGESVCGLGLNLWNGHILHLCNKTSHPLQSPYITKFIYAFVQSVVVKYRSWRFSNTYCRTLGTFKGPSTKNTLSVQCTYICKKKHYFFPSKHWNFEKADLGIYPKSFDFLWSEDVNIFFAKIGILFQPGDCRALISNDIVFQRSDDGSWCIWPHSGCLASEIYYLKIAMNISL